LTPLCHQLGELSKKDELLELLTQINDPEFMFRQNLVSLKYVDEETENNFMNDSVITIKGMSKVALLE
jgi:hypothetical protein